MQIKTVRFTNPDQDEVEVCSDLGDFYLPWPCHSWHRQAISDWLERGNKICAYRRDQDPEELRRCLVQEVYSQAAQLLEAATAGYAVAEQIMWPELEREARRFLTNGALGPLMRAELEDEGRSSEELAYAVIHRANRLTRYRGAVVAARARHVASIRRSSLAELEQYRSDRGWPALDPD
jgi:hypothetical protein